MAQSAAQPAFYDTHTVLIMDDMPANLGIVVKSLEGEGIRVVIAQDGEEGLQRAEFVQPDLILLDVMMPGMDGFETCRRLKARTSTRDIPVIFMTALGDTEYKLSGFAAGGVDYLTKPLQIEEVMARVRMHLNLHTMQRRLTEQNLQLQHYRDRLELQVAERTAALSESNRQLREEIAERKHIEEALRASEKQCRTLVENSPDIIIRYDRECRRIYVNPAYEREMGVSCEQACECSLDENWWADVPVHEYKKVLRQVMETGSASESWAMQARHKGVAAYYAFNLVAEHDPDGQVTGVLAIGRNITAIRQAERQLEESYAQLRELAAHQETVREEERKHIARELHDELGQCLTALRMNVSVLRVQYGTDNPKMLAHIKCMTELVDRTIQVIRNVASSLRPAALDMGIVSSLEWLAEEFASHSGIPCELRIAVDDIVLDEDCAVALFRIVQESLTNVARHAQAGRVEISLRREDGQYCLDVRDDGKGFDPAVPKAKSFGLVGVRERVLMLGGEVSLSTGDGQGTTLGVRIPIHRNPQEDTGGGRRGRKSGVARPYKKIVRS